MLVHNMGAGLADNRPDYNAGPQDWLTAALWGIGLYTTLNNPGFTCMMALHVPSPKLLCGMAAKLHLRRNIFQIYSAQTGMQC
jgi:hypothetical protein